MRTPIIKQLYEVFDSAKENEKLFAFCYSIPKDIALSKPIWFDDVLMKEADGTIVKKKYITTNAIRVVDLRPVCVIVETLCSVFICLKPGAQDFDQKALKKVLNMGKSTKNVSCDIEYIFYTNAMVDGNSIYYHNSVEGVSNTLSFDTIYDFGNLFLAVTVDKPNRTDANFKIQILMDQYNLFYPQLG